MDFKESLRVAYYSATGKLIGDIPVKENREVARRAATEGIVLLKNEGVLPLVPGNIALFGCGSEDTAFCGTGSGYAFSPKNISVYEGLKNAGFTITSEKWLKNYRDYKKEIEKKGDQKLTFLDKRFSGVTIYTDAKEITDEEAVEARTGQNAIYVIKRNTGEGYDRKPEKGDYYLSDNESANLKKLSSYFENVIVVLNTCVVDVSELKDDPSIKAVVVLGQAGMEAGNALADVLTGKVSPSGRLTDTWALRYDDYPASATFSANDGCTTLEEYKEDIFVGYRHFDKKGLDVTYPFGYGLSYTTFRYEDIDVKADPKEVKVTLYVTNTGNVPSKEVVQVYVSAPAGKLNKPVTELKGYAKTPTLKPGESHQVVITIPVRDLSSYDTETSSWILEKGNYIIYAGRNSRDKEAAATLVLDETVSAVKLTENCFALDEAMELLDYPAQEDRVPEGKIIELRAADFVTLDESSKIDRTLPVYVPEGETYVPHKGTYHFPVETEEKAVTVRKVNNATLPDVVDGKITMPEFIASLDKEILIRLCTGDSQETKIDVAPRLPKGAFKSVFTSSTSGKTTNMFAETLGIPAMSLADGPAGLHLMGSPSTCFPVGMVLAQSWNDDLGYEIGDAYGKEMELCHAAVTLGPGMNIHRDPLCGRNFEYYSEDPLVTGNTAVSFIRGLQEKHPGYGVAIKHFCCNNQELTRNISNSRVSERALREIYLKGFEIAVKKAKPHTLMSSYNLVNGIHTSSRYDLLTDVLRGEWGFDGMVMTDWDGMSDRVSDLYAGNDILMGGYFTDPLIAVMDDKEPEWNDDGTVKKQQISMYGGVMKKEADLYNCFLPDKNGDACVEVFTEHPNLEALDPLIKEGIVTTEVLEDGRTKVTYKGYDRSYSLPLSVIQRNAIRVLNELAYKAPMALAERK